MASSASSSSSTAKGLDALTIADRATLGNMCPEYGATVAIFPIDEMTLDYLRLTGRDPERVQLVETYAKEQGLFRADGAPDATYSEVLIPTLDDRTEPCRAEAASGSVTLKRAKSASRWRCRRCKCRRSRSRGQAPPKVVPVRCGRGNGRAGAERRGRRGPGAGARPRRRRDRGHNQLHEHLESKRHDRRRPAGEEGRRKGPDAETVGEEQPGARLGVVTEYLEAAGLTPYLDTLGFNLVGYGCTTCIGNSGPLPDEIAAVIRDRNLVVCSVLSGNRNFEGRIQQDVRANYLASPPLVVAYALAGWITKDLTVEPLGKDQAGNPVYLKDIWPSEQELQATMLRSVTSDMFRSSYSDVFKGDERWQALQVLQGQPFHLGRGVDVHPQADVFEGMTMTPEKPSDIVGARVLALLGDSVTTDHISPAGSIMADSPGWTIPD